VGEGGLLKPSGVDKNPALAHGALDHRACHDRAAPGEIRIDDNDVSGHLKAPQATSQAYRFFGGVLDYRLDHEEVEVALQVGVPPCVGAEEDDPCVGRRGSYPSPSLGDELLVDAHMGLTGRHLNHALRNRIKALHGGASTDPRPAA